MVKVVATGVFELIHPGHLLYLEESRKLGDELVVVVARDKTVLERKKRRCVPENQRLHVVNALKPVDKAVLGDEEKWYKTIKEIEPDILTLGPDQDFDKEQIQERLDREGIDCNVVRIGKHWDGDFNSSKKIRECHESV